MESKDTETEQLVAKLTKTAQYLCFCAQLEMNKAVKEMCSELNISEDDLTAGESLSKDEVDLFKSEDISSVMNRLPINFTVASIHYKTDLDDLVYCILTLDRKYPYAHYTVVTPWKLLHECKALDFMKYD